MHLSPADGALQIAGLPLHPLIVHAVVILTPLTVLALLLGAFWPAARRRLGIVTPLAALVVLVLVPITVVAGESLEELVGSTPAVERHGDLGRMFLPWAIALFLLATAQWAWHRFWRPAVAASSKAAARVVGVVLALLSALVGVGAVVMLVLIGDAGARAVWGGLIPS